MKDAETYCKKCAYEEDINFRVMCQVCKKNYHTISMNACMDCMMIEFHEEEEKRKIGTKYKKCSNCFWKFCNPITWKDFDNSPLRMLEVKGNRYNNCNESNDFYSEIWTCKKCNSPIDGHQEIFHDKLCEPCWMDMVSKQSS